MNKIGIASDHAGYEMKEFLVGYLDAMGYEVLDSARIRQTASTMQTSRIRWPRRSKTANWNAASPSAARAKG